MTYSFSRFDVGWGRPSVRLAVIVCSLLLCTCPTTIGREPGSLEASELEKRVRQASRTDSFQKPSTAELRVAERLFERTLRGDEPIQVLRDAWAENHFRLAPFSLGAQRLWLPR